jgi:hypothetical protein
MSEETSHLLEAFDALPAVEKVVFAAEVLNRVSSNVAPIGSGRERAKALREWAQSHPHNSSVLSDDAISRDSIYHDRVNDERSHRH